MKYLIFSDIHGSSYYMDIILDFFDKSDCDKMLCLGDLLYHGPRNDLPYGHNPKAIVQRINKYRDDIIMVKGNCEAEVDQMVLDFKIYDDYILDDNKIYLTHGQHINPEHPLNNNAVKIVFFGHTHVPTITKVNGTFYINCGSVSLPKENSGHSFIVFEKGNISCYNIIDGKCLLIVNKIIDLD